MVFSIHKGWTFLVLAVLLAGIGGAIHFGVGIGFMISAVGFAFAALVDGISHCA